MPSPGQRRPTPSPGLRSSASAGHLGHCNACGSTPTSRCSPRYGALGLVALPQAWLFQIFLALISPFVDLLLIVQLVAAASDYVQHGAQFDPTNLKVTLFYYAIFITVDIATAAVAFLFERRENWQLLWWLVLQRFGYRQLLYYVLAKSVSTAAKGHLVGWGKLDRKATVTPGNI